MKNKIFVLTLQDTLKKLEFKNAKLMSHINNIQTHDDNDPEKSRIHDMWHAYRMQTEFKEFIESLLRKHNGYSNAI